jgi:hypothetical protein
MTRLKVESAYVSVVLTLFLALQILVNVGR